MEAIPSSSPITTTKIQAVIIKMIRIRQIAQMAQILVPQHSNRTRSNGLERLAAIHRMKRSSESALRDSGPSTHQSTNSNQTRPATRVLQTLLTRSQQIKRRVGADIGPIVGSPTKSASTCTQHSSASSSQNASTVTNAYTCILKLSVNLARTAHA